MSPEIPGGRDHPSQAPRNNGSHGNDRPENGYPPKGYAENKQQLSMQEAITIATENPDGQLEKELALADILPWVKECLPDCQPHKLAAECCFSMQVEARELDETYQITDENPEDIKPDVEQFIAENKNSEVISENEQTISENDDEIEAKESEQVELTAQAEAQTADIADVRAEIAQKKAKTPKLENDVTESQQSLDSTLSKEAEKSADLDRIKKLQAEFETLKAEKGTIGALRTLLKPGRLKSPEMKAKVQLAVNVAQSLVNAIPGKYEVVSRILDQSNVNLAAANPITIFAGFLAETDKSEELTDEEKTKLREVFVDQIPIRSGADMKKVLETGRGVRTKPDGNTEIIPYDKDNMAEITPGQKLYHDESGDPILRVEIEDGNFFEFELPEDSAADMGKVGIMAQVIDKLADYNLDQAIFQKGFQMQAGGRISLEFPKDWVTTERVLKIFFGGVVGWDNKLLDRQQLHDMEYLLQGLATKGDAARADGDNDRAMKDLSGIGIIKEGEVDWQRFGEVIQYNRDHRYTYMIDYDLLPEERAA